MDDFLENIEAQKMLFLNTSYGVEMRRTLCETINNILYCNDFVNDTGDESVLPSILDMAERIKDVNQKMEENKELLAIARKKFDAISILYDNLRMYTITDVETGIDYNYVGYGD